MGILSALFGEKDNKALKTAIGDDALLVDVRSPREFSFGSVKGAVNIPLNSVKNNLDAFKEKPKIVVFCASGNRSGQAKRILNKNGIENVINGGAWTNVNKIVIDKKMKR